MGVPGLGRCEPFVIGRTASLIDSPRQVPVSFAGFGMAAVVVVVVAAPVQNIFCGSSSKKNKVFYFEHPHPTR